MTKGLRLLVPLLNQPERIRLIEIPDLMTKGLRQQGGTTSRTAVVSIEIPDLMTKGLRRFSHCFISFVICLIEIPDLMTKGLRRFYISTAPLRPSCPITIEIPDLMTKGLRH